MKTAPLSKSQSQTAEGLRLVLSRLTRSLRKHGISGLTASQISALATVREFGPIRISELAAREGVGAPVATRVTTSLEDLGYLRRVSDLQDKRACLVEISASGLKVLKNLWEERTHEINQRIHRLTRAEIETINATLPILEKLAKEV